MVQNENPYTKTGSLGSLYKTDDLYWLEFQGPLRMAKTKAVQIGLNNDWLKTQGLVSVREKRVKFHYLND